MASAETFEVNSTADEVDAVLGNETCLTAEGKCTLRAAIEEADESAEEFDSIHFDEEVFEGQAGDTIVLGSSLPPVTDSVEIFGRTCATAAGASGPCVGVDGLGGSPALTIENADGVEVWGLAITGAQTGIEATGSPELRIQASWIGVELDGGEGANGTGIFLGPGSNDALIGSEGAERRDVIANSSADGLDIHGASRARVLGDYFGVEPDGSTLAANGKDIEVTSESGGLEAAENRIGTKVEPEFVGGSCDRGCNVISGASSSGVDLQGNGGSEAPAVATTILGNFIGLDAAGAAAVPNAAAGILVGEAAQTVIGGPKAAEANRVNGGTVGVLSGPAAPDLLISGNLIGVDAGGAGSLAPPGEGIVVESAELPSPALEATIVGNRLIMEGGVGIAQHGYGARVGENEIRGAGTGIWTSGTIETHGNRIERNTIEGAAGSAILVENNLNEVLGNEIFQVLGAGIRVHGTLPFGVTENVIGGDSAGEENLVVGSGGAAIEISDLEETENEVARNRGFANGGQFIDLVAAGAEPAGPNAGIEPPAISTAVPTGASGNGAKPGARIRAFRKQSAEPGELQSYLGEATADAEGNWEVTYSGAIPAGTIVAATQTSEAGGTSELSTATTAGPSGGGPGGGGAVDRSPPQTRIVKGPKARSASHTARFRFTSDEAGSSFQCKLDRKPFAPCGSPKRYGGLKAGGHVFQVRAVDSAGNVDPSPARRKFTVRR